jgi:hypothetical protein
MKLFGLAIVGAVALGPIAACGGSGATQPTPTLATASASATTSAAITPVDYDKDSLALFPANALAMFTLDLRAFYTSPLTRDGAGPAAVALAEKYFPIGAEANFSASRDLDRVTGGVYSMQGADALVTMVGRFDAAKINALATNRTQTHAGGVVAAQQYAGRTLFTIADFGFTILTPHLVLAGTKTTIKRALDRIRDNKATHDAPKWMLDTLATVGAAGAVALDMKNVPLAQLTGGFPLKGTDGMTALRLLGNFQAPGMHVAGSATYVDEAHAKAGAEGLKSLMSSTAFTVLFSALGVSIQNPNVVAAQSDAQISFAVDDASLRNLLTRLPSAVGP